MSLLNSEIENKLFRSALDFSSTFSMCTDFVYALSVDLSIPAQRCEDKKLNNNYADIKRCPTKQICRKLMRYSILVEQRHNMATELFSLNYIKSESTVFHRIQSNP